jgi:hypothetical protein
MSPEQTNSMDVRMDTNQYDGMHDGLDRPVGAGGEELPLFHATNVQDGTEL